MSGPLAGFGGKPILSKETPDRRFIGRIIVELYEGPNTPSDAHGLVLSISPARGSNISQDDLLKRIATALPVRVSIRKKALDSKES